MVFTPLYSKLYTTANLIGWSKSQTKSRTRASVNVWVISGVMEMFATFQLSGSVISYRP